jgi:aryl-alcohol dehydrogenase-like predicted oxidoreductase
MEYRGHRGWRISEVGVGCYALSGVYGQKEPAEYRCMLERAYELGVNFFDTADAYGDAERILGETLRPFRDEVYVATKVGVRQGVEANLSGDYVRAACEESLRRLGTETIDLYQVHFDDPATPVEETVAALDGLVAAGKVRRYGVGHLPPSRVREYFREGDIFSVMVELSAVARDALETTLPLCREHGVGAIAFSVTGRGLLTGRYQLGHQFAPGDIRSIDPLFQRERFESGLRVAERLAEIGRGHGKSAVQVGIAWALAQPGVICALVGPSTVAHLEEDLGGVGWHLPLEEEAALDSFLSEEVRRLARAQRASVGDILSGPLPEDPEQAFKDLLYALETVVQLGLASEAEVLPLLHELFGLRERLDASALPGLQDLCRRMGGVFGSGAASP